MSRINQAKEENQKKVSLREKVKTLWFSIPLNVDTITLECVWNYKQTRCNNRYARSWMNLTLVDYIGVRH